MDMSIGTRPPVSLYLPLFCVLTAVGCRHEQIDWHSHLHENQAGKSEPAVIDTLGPPDVRVQGLREFVRRLPRDAEVAADYAKFVPQLSRVPSYQEHVLRQMGTDYRKPYDPDWWRKEPFHRDALLAYEEQRRFSTPYYGGGFVAYIWAFREGRCVGVYIVRPWFGLRDAPATQPQPSSLSKPAPEPVTTHRRE